MGIGPILTRPPGVRDEGSGEIARRYLNFVGAGVDVVDDPANNELEINISGAAPGASGGEFFHAVLEYNADYTGAANTHTQLQAAIDAASAAGGGIVYLPAGTYLIGAPLELKSNVKLLGSPGSVLRKNYSGNNTYIVRGIGTLSAAISLSADAAEGDPTITTATIGTLAAGDLVLIRDASYEFSIAGGASYNGGRNQEINRIKSISGSGPYTITLANELIGSYTTANTAEILEITGPTNLTVEGIKFDIPSGTTGTHLYFEYAAYIRVYDNEFINPAQGDGGAVDFYRSAFAHVSRNRIRDAVTQTSNNGYAFTARESSHHIIFDGNSQENVRESGFSDGTKYCSFVNNASRSTNDNAINTHGGGCRHILIAYNIITGNKGSAAILAGFNGAKAADFDVQIIGNIIKGVDGNGITVAGASSSLKTMRVLVADNDIDRFCQVFPDSSKRGILVQNAKHVTLRGNRVRNPLGSVVAAIGIGTGTSYILVQGNQIVDIATASSDGIKLEGATVPDRVSIIGNVIENVADQDINYSVAATNVVVAHNNCDGETNVPATGGTVIRSRNIFGTTIDPA